MILSQEMASAYVTALRVAGQDVTFQRIVGVAPSATLEPPDGATVTAVVKEYIPDTTQNSATGWSASQIGSVTVGDRVILVMSKDLADAGFPMPVQKGDQAIIVCTGETLSIVSVDASKRFAAGCIELKAMGVA